MNCKRIQELLMTDYIDGEMTQEQERQFKGHLHMCEACKQFEASLQEKAKEPFQGVEKVVPSESLWYRVQDTIEAEKSSRSIFSGVFDSMPDFLSGRKPAFAVATLAAIIFAAVVLIRLPFNGRESTAIYLAEQAEFLSYLSGENGVYNGDFYLSDSDAAIEEYFL
ncbi:zf-HC2 domain-containing protein [Candidatus Omnitrophota bacterium]